MFKYVQHQDMTSGEWDSTYGLGEAGAGDEGYYGEACGRIVRALKGEEVESYGA